MMKNEPKLNPRQIRYLASIGVISPSNSQGGRGRTRSLSDGEQRIIDLVAAIREKGMSIKNIHPAALASIAVNSSLPFLYLNDPSDIIYDTRKLFCIYWDGSSWWVGTREFEVSRLIKKAMREKAAFYNTSAEKFKELKELFDDPKTDT